jgi:hypothetical protein
MAEDYKWWFEYHNEDYESVLTRLKACRNILLHGPKDRAARLLEVSAINSILSIQTARQRHERAFTMHYAGGLSLENCAKETVYGYQKSDWLHKNKVQVDWGELVSYIRGQVFAGNPVAAVEKVTDEVTGLSWTKGGFTLAMCGIVEVACPDSRTRAELGIENNVRTESDYREALQVIDESVPIDMPLFVKQWVLYDYFEQEHADHQPFFTEALQLAERDNQL